MLNQWVIVYIDDILIYSETYAEHVRHVSSPETSPATSTVRQGREMRVPSRDHLLPRVCDQLKRVDKDEQKVQAVVNWPQPTTLKELQRFLGFANFYRRFICNFSTIAAPMKSTIKAGTQRLTWSSAAIASFRSLKERFTIAPILHHPDPDLEFIVEVDDIGVQALGQCSHNARVIIPNYTPVRSSPANWTRQSRIMTLATANSSLWRQPWLPAKMSEFTLRDVNLRSSIAVWKQLFRRKTETFGNMKTLHLHLVI